LFYLYSTIKMMHGPINIKAMFCTRTFIIVVLAGHWNVLCYRNTTSTAQKCT